MKELKKRLEEYKDKLQNDTDYEMSDEMQEEYLDLKEEIESYGDMNLREKFSRLSNQYENPDSIIEALLKDMYPDTDGGFDLDDF